MSGSSFPRRILRADHFRSVSAFRATRMSRIPTLCTFLLTLLLVCQAPAVDVTPTALSSGTKPSPWIGESLAIEPLREAMGAAEGALAKLPAEAALDSPEGIQRAAWNRRVELLKELVATLQTRQEVEESRQKLPGRRTKLEADLRALDSTREPAIPSRPVLAESEALKGKLDAQRQALESLRQEAAARAKLLDNLPSLRNVILERESTAQKTASQLRTEFEETTDESQRTALTLQLENAELEMRVTRENLASLEAQVALETNESIYRNQAVAYAQRQIQQTEDYYSRYQKALSSALYVRQQQAQDELATRKEAAENATSAAQQFLARWEASAAESQASRAALEIRKSILSTLISQQEKRLQGEKDRLLTLQELTGRVAASGRAGEALKATYHRIRQLRRSPVRIFGPSVKADLEQHRNRRFELDEQIFSIFDDWRQEFTQVAATLPASQRPSFEKEAARLRDACRNVFLEEHALLTEVISSETSLQDLGLRLGSAIDELETFILPKLFWIRDAQPLGANSLGRIREELNQLSGWFYGFGKSPDREALAATLRTPSTLFLGVLLLGVFPPVLVFLRGGLRRAVASAGRARRGTEATLLALVGTGVLVLYLGIVAGAIRILPLPESLSDVASELVLQVTLVAFLWRLNRSFIRPGGIAELHYGLATDTAHTLHGSLRFILVASLFLLVPCSLLRQSPYLLEILPRLCFSLFGVVLLIPMFRLVRASSPVVRDFHPSSSKPSRIPGSWQLLSTLALLVLMGSMIMDFLGYRYGALRIAKATLLTLFTLAGALALYKVLLPLSLRVLEHRRREVTAPPGAAPPRLSAERRKQIRAFLKTSLSVTALLLTAVWWEVNEHAISALGTIHIWKAGADPAMWVSAADLLQCVGVFALTLWLMRNLAGLYEVAIFPRLELDAGARYAVLTISRYGLFVIGMLTALASINLNLNQIGWLMAAVGFGLGFGMQEIFSNFVSGLILLLERPVRVGDTAKVGDVIGRVTRINIRATTITTDDRCEAIIPNKDLITKSVTNWTFADKTTGVVVPISVPYGSDIEEIRSLLLELAVGQPEILRSPAPQALLMGQGESSLKFELRFSVRNPDLSLPLQDRLNTLVNKALTARGIGIPLPQRELHIKSSEFLGGSLSSASGQAGSR